MDIKAIIDSCGYEKEKNKQDLERWIKSISALLDKKNIKEALMDEQILCKILQPQKNGGISGQNYSRVKRHANVLQAFYGVPLVVPSRETVLKAKKQICLYKNLEALLDFVDNVGESIIPDYRQNEDFLKVKSIAVLGWHGFSLSDISAFKKEQLHDDGEVCTAGEVSMDRKFFTILKKLAETVRYRGLPGGKPQIFKSDNTYLFRSILSDKLFTKGQLADVLRRFNNMAVSFSRAIVFRNLRENALFLEMAKEMPLKNISHKIEKVFGYDSKTACRKQVVFLHWYNNIYLS